MRFTAKLFLQVIVGVFLMAFAQAKEISGRILNLIADDEGLKVVMQLEGPAAIRQSYYLSNEHRQYKLLSQRLRTANEQKKIVVLDVQSKNSIVTIENAKVRN